MGYKTGKMSQALAGIWLCAAWQSASQLNQILETKKKKKQEEIFFHIS